MIRTFGDRGTADRFDGGSSKAARRRCPVGLWSISVRKLDQLDQAHGLADLAAPPGNHLEALRGDRVGQHSIRINQHFRICFVWRNGAAEEVEVVDYHR